MTPRFKLALAGLVALVLSTGITYLLLQNKGPGESDVAMREGELGEGTGDGLLGADPASRGTRGDPSFEVSGQAPLGARERFGADFTDPAFRARRLVELLGAPGIKWDDVRALLKLMTEPLPSEAKHVLLHRLRMGPERGQVLRAFDVVQDETLIRDLGDLLDEPGRMDSGKRAALQALARMPAGDDDEIAKLIAERLTGTFNDDVWTLQAIAQRGGTEATKSFLAYLAKVDPSTVRPNAFLAFDMATTPEAQVALRTALEQAKTPEMQQALLAIAARPGAKDISATILALDSPEADRKTRLQALRSLAIIGDEPAVRHLLATAQGTGQLANQALDALRSLRSATPEVRTLLRAELEKAGLSDQPSKTKRRLAETLGMLKDEKSLPQIVGLLDDPDPAVSRTAIVSMGRMGRAASSYVNTLASRFDTGSTQVRGAVVNALTNIGGQSSYDLLVKWATRSDLPAGLSRALQTSIARVREGLKRPGR